MGVDGFTRGDVRWVGDYLRHDDFERAENFMEHDVMGKYDDAAVEALISVTKKHLEDNGGWSIALRQSIDRLQPKPEMEYVLKEFGAYPVVKYNLCTDFISVGYCCFSETVWNSIREATRVPAKPKQGHVPAGKDWSESDLLELNRAWLLNTSDLHQAAMAVIDHIKQKCGV